MVEKLGIVAVVGAAAVACEVRVTMTPGDVVGSVTERLSKLWVARAGDVCEV